MLITYVKRSGDADKLRSTAGLLRILRDSGNCGRALSVAHRHRCYVSDAFGCETTLSAALLARLNPIELAFSKLKAHPRKAAQHTIPSLLRRIARVLNAFSSQECKNFLRHAGYLQT
jgi:hypothetical protein